MKIDLTPLGYPSYLPDRKTATAAYHHVGTRCGLSRATLVVIAQQCALAQKQLSIGAHRAFPASAGSDGLDERRTQGIADLFSITWRAQRHRKGEGARFDT